MKLCREGKRETPRRVTALTRLQIRRDTQVERERSAKPLDACSIHARASKDGRKPLKEQKADNCHPSKK